MTSFAIGQTKSPDTGKSLVKVSESSRPVPTAGDKESGRSSIPDGLKDANYDDRDSALRPEGQKRLVDNDKNRTLPLLVHGDKIYVLNSALPDDIENLDEYQSEENTWWHGLSDWCASMCYISGIQLMNVY